MTFAVGDLAFTTGVAQRKEQLAIVLSIRRKPNLGGFIETLYKVRRVDFQPFRFFAKASGAAVSYTVKEVEVTKDQLKLYVAKPSETADISVFNARNRLEYHARSMFIEEALKNCVPITREALEKAEQKVQSLLSELDNIKTDADDYDAIGWSPSEAYEQSGLQRLMDHALKQLPTKKD
jgi:hypothetical protein